MCVAVASFFFRAALTRILVVYSCAQLKPDRSHPPAARGDSYHPQAPCSINKKNKSVNVSGINILGKC